MHYIGSHEAINWLFILACLAVLQWVLTISFVAKNYNTLGSKINSNASSIFVVDAYKSKVSFRKDYFYIYWNIYPIIFYAFFYYLDTSWDNYLNQIVMIYGNNARVLYDSWFKVFNFSGFNIDSFKITNFLKFSIDYKYIDVLVILIATVLAYMATFGTQIKKQIQFIEDNKKLYWWDIRINKQLYWIRFIFLFFNIILVAFIAYMGLKVALFITFLLLLNVTVNPFHPDGYGGLEVIMEIASVILSIYLLRGMMGIVGLIDHKGVKDKLQFLGDLYHTSYLFFGIGFMVFFIYKVNAILDKINISDLLSHSVYKTYSVCKDINLSSSDQVICNDLNSSKLAQIAGDMSNYYSNLINFNKFPIDLSLFWGSVFTFILPLALWAIISFAENRSNEFN